jgi:uncharacterized protein (DUF362 family)
MTKIDIFHGEDCLSQFTTRICKDLTSELYHSLSMDKPVLIKPNMLRNEKADTGITTDVRVVEPIVIGLTSLGYNVMVGDGGESCLDTYDSFQTNGYVDMCEKYDIRLIDLNKGPLVPKVIGGVQMFINRYALESQVVSVAKLKPHGMFKVTGTLKNLMGCVLPKGHMHDNFTTKIEDVYNYINPAFGIIDGLVANGRCENIPCGVKMNTIIAGKCLPCVDKVESMILGREAEHIESLFKKIDSKDKSVIEFTTVADLANLYSRGGVK